jgi:hypothetical protein
VIDRRFCSAEHRRRWQRRSARALRDAGEIIGDYEEFLILPERKTKSNGNRFGNMSALVIGLIVGLCLWMIPSAPVPVSQKLRYTLSNNRLSEIARGLFPDSPKINLRQDFRLGAGDWVGRDLSTGEHRSGMLHPDRLKVWKPSVRLRDYQLEFQGSIEKRALGWAFRAADVENYYGAKLTLGQQGGRSEIERFVMLNGRETDRVRLPIPLLLQPSIPYRVRVKVKGDFFATAVNGQIVDTWRDRRHTAGGVGFFTDRGEQASVRWVSLSEPESFFSRLLAMGFLLAPPAMVGMPAGSN